MKAQWGSILCIFIFSVYQLANAQSTDITTEVNKDGDGSIEVTVEYILSPHGHFNPPAHSCERKGPR